MPTHFNCHRQLGCLTFADSTNYFGVGGHIVFRFLRHVAIALSMVLSTTLSAYSQGPDDDEPPEFIPGLIASYSVDGIEVKQIDQDILFDWGQSSPTQRLPAGDFKAEWIGLLQAKENGVFRLSVFVNGKVTISLGGNQVLAAESNTPRWLDCEPIELRFGMHALQVEFEKTHAPARLGLYWSGPTFALEPISSRTYFHPAEQTISRSFETGELLARGLRCAACHEFEDMQLPLQAPSLTHLQGNLRPSWLVERLTSRPEGEGDFSQTRMPHFALHPNDARAITAALFRASAKSQPAEDIGLQLQAANKKRGKKDPVLRTQADVAQGEIAFVSTGCLACHSVGELGRTTKTESQLFGGGDLAGLAAKRTNEFHARWLANPQQVNAQHRMPVFDLTLLERLDVVAYLQQLGSASSPNDTQAAGDADRGVGLIAQHRCGACHQLPASLNATLQKLKIASDSDWELGGCMGQPDARQQLPGFQLTVAQRKALREFLTSARSDVGDLASGPRLLIENNCVACHSRDLNEGLSKAKLAEIVVAVPDVAPRLAAIAPPSLTAIGDKLQDHALRGAISLQAPRLRPWLDVRMPKFRLSDQQLSAIVAHVVAHDRIPEGKSLDVIRAHEALAAASDSQKASTLLAAGRLVTAEGFGCQSCHQIGETDPPKVDLNARGTNLAMIGERIRPSWFDRWVRNPARIVPRMEMPAIQTAVNGVLHDSLDEQLAALWTTLNTPDFRPPRAAPVRIVRTHNIPSRGERAWLLTDVLETPGHVYLRPLIFGLPNRQNLLFDLESGRLSTWWIGDAAHQHTRGKSWFWEPGANPIVDHEDFLEQVNVVDSAGVLWVPAPLGQFAARLDGVEHIENGIEWRGRLHLSAVESSGGNVRTRWISIKQTVHAAHLGQEAVSEWSTELSGLLPGDRVRLNSSARVVAEPTLGGGKWQVGLQLSNTLIEIRGATPIVSESNDRSGLLLETPAGATQISWTSRLSSLLPTDQFPYGETVVQVVKPKQVDIVPGFAGLQLPLPPTEMPISFAWDSAGSCYVGSLKGRVLRLRDQDADGLSDTYELISDEFPTPFGLYASEDGIDALTKFALIRLNEPKVAATPYTATVVADGWGYTADYHDWAIGLERDADRNYYMALPCQQDDRSEEAAYLRGSALKLIPHDATEEPRKYRIEPISAGLRFPIGIALNAERDLFTSDNQGNYNPFNELNHLRPGKRYGFINKLENKDGYSPAFESPAINLPHPWTRSVNGICFLKTPDALASNGSHFGPYEGHLIGCEMNGRSLVRMSLQKVGETYQGAAYMFSRPVANDEANLEGPIVCEVSPEGDIYVGSLQDSGWSGGQNTGSIVRLRPTRNWPLGIAEVRATSNGFEIDFTQQIDAEKAALADNYQLRSYQRVSTPAYGGDDQDERTERLSRIHVSGDRRRVFIELDNLRAGFVYEINVRPIGSDDHDLLPSQAHYSLRSLVPN